MKIKCNKCYIGYLRVVDLNEGMANYEYLISRHKLLCDNCKEEYQDVQIMVDLNNKIKEIKLIK